MYLPEMIASKKLYKNTISAFKGLNVRQNIESGEFTFCYQLSHNNYPAISPPKSNTIYAEYSEPPTALFEWDGHIIIVDGGVLYYDDTALDNVLPGEKQFAVVNTKLVIWPDKTYIDLTNGKYGSLSSKAVTASAGTFTANSLTAAVIPKVHENVMPNGWGGSVTSWAPITYFYGQDPSKLSWNATTGWTLPAATAKGIPWGMGSFPDSAIGDIFIPSKDNNSYRWVNAITTSGAASDANSIDTSKYNTEGYYGVVTKKDGTWSVYEGETSVKVYFDVYKKGLTNPLFSSYFVVGDRVTVSLAGTNYCEKAKIASFDNATNKITFTASVFTAGTAPAGITIQKDIPDLDYICSCNNRLYGCSNAVSNKIWDAETSAYKIFTSRCLYVSALGLPDRFWDFDGIDSDSYQVAIASEGDFTCAVALDGSVLFHKEKLVYRLYGDYPSNFYLSEYTMPGCAAGCHKSAKIINEVLYYLAPHGVYAYSGNTPTLISYKLGDIDAEKAAAGTVETKYWLSVLCSNGDKKMYVYDTDVGFWLFYSNIWSPDFATVNGYLFYIDAINVIKENSGSGTNYVWYAYLKPEDENTLRKKYYVGIYLNIYLPANSHITVTCLDGNGTLILSQLILSTKETERIAYIPLNGKRTDKLEIRLEGYGPALIKSITRAFYLGSEEAT